MAPRMYRRMTGTDLWRLWRMMSRSATPASAADVMRPAAQRVAGEPGRIDAGRLGGALHHLGHCPIRQAGGAEVAVAVGGCCLEPRPVGPHRAGARIGAVRRAPQGCLT